MTKEQLVAELRNSLPSINYLSTVNVAAVKVRDELIYLKIREGEGVEEKDLELWEGGKEGLNDYSELHGKNVLLDVKLFGKRGFNAIVKYLQTNW